MVTLLNEKKITKAGAVTIPLHLRRELGITAGDKITVSVVGDGDLLLRRNTGHCILCGRQEANLIRIHDKFICHECAERLKQIIDHEKDNERKGEGNVSQ